VVFLLYLFFFPNLNFYIFLRLFTHFYSPLISSYSFIYLFIYHFFLNTFIHKFINLKHNHYFFQVTRVLSIANLVRPPFEKACENCHVVDVIIFSSSKVHCNVCHSKSKVLSFFVAPL
jgi:hypothetical protein